MTGLRGDALATAVGLVFPRSTGVEWLTGRDGAVEIRIHFSLSEEQIRRARGRSGMVDLLLGDMLPPPGVRAAAAALDAPFSARTARHARGRRRR